MSDREQVDILVLGGGIAGLAAAAGAREVGRRAVVLERGSRAGGILDGFEIQGFRFDNGVHLSFATEPEVRSVFDQTDYLEHDAVSQCWDDGYWLNHPVQNNLYPLPAEEKARLIEGLVRQQPGKISSYHDWLVQQYGEPIATRWPLVYTEKYWTIPAREMGTKWVGPRMRQADLREVLLGAMAESVPNTYYISKMRYPRRGGFGAFVAPLITQADVRIRHAVTRVDPIACVVHCENGTSFGYRNLISTLPLPYFVSMLPNVPEEIEAASKSLFATSVDLISIGLNQPQTSPRLWLYIYDRDIWAARLYAPDLKSPDNVPDGCSAVQFEIYSSTRAPNPHSAEEMIENCLAALERMSLAKRTKVRLAHHKRLAYANVVFDQGMEGRRDLVRSWVENLGIRLAGRFGEWAYLWSNQSMISGRRAVQALTRGDLKGSL